MAATAASLSLSFAERTAHAEPASFDLAWSAPAECPSGQEIVEATRARLGATRSGDLPELFVEGTVTTEPNAFLVTLAMKDRAGGPIGRRQVHVRGPNCSAVTGATALMLAMIITARPPADPPSASAPHASPAEAPTPPSAPDSAPRPAPSSQEARGRAPPDAPARRLFVGASAIVSRGVLPETGVGVAVRTTYSPIPLLLLGLEASFEVGGSVRDETAEVNFQLMGGSALAGIQVLHAPRWELILTLSAQAAVVRTSGSGFHATAADDSLRAIALVGPGPLLRARLSPSLFVEAFARAEAVLVRDRFHLRDGDTVSALHRPAAVAGRFALGIAYEFP